MSKKDEILSLVEKNGGYVTTRELKRNNINTYYLNCLIKEKN